MFELKLTNNVTCFSVTFLQLYIQFSFHIITHDMALYKRLTSYRQNTHIEIIYSIRASRASEENLCIPQFQTCYKLVYKCPVRGKNLAIFRWNYQILTEKTACTANFRHMQLTCTYIVKKIGGGGLSDFFFFWGGGAWAPKAPLPLEPRLNFILKSLRCDRARYTRTIYFKI